MNEKNNIKINPVGHDDVQDLIGIEVAAIQIAEGGAMGRPGGVFIVTTDARVFLTYLRGHLPEEGSHREMVGEDIVSIIPMIADFRSGLMGYGVQHPAGWYHHYLGMGNHLLVKAEYEPLFLKEAQILEGQNPEEILYNLWLEAILNVLKPTAC